MVSNWVHRFARQQSARGVPPRDRRRGGVGDVIVGLVLARAFGWMWMDPVAGVGAFVIASWALSLIRDTSAILLDMNPDRRMPDHLKEAIESEGDRIADLHSGGSAQVTSAQSCRWSRQAREARPTIAPASRAFVRSRI